MLTSQPSDVAVHRCAGCGSWLLGARPCPACSAFEARHARELDLAQLVRGHLSPTYGQARL